MCKVRQRKEHTCGDVSLASSVDPELELEVEVDGAGLVARRRLCEYTFPWA